VIKLFRNSKKKMVAKGKIGNYLLYALGEIILVVLGILIALQINNINEDYKSKKQLNTILKTVSYDLATDTLVVNPRLCIRTL